jgi:protein O-mannosyl-transferase
MSALCGGTSLARAGPPATQVAAENAAAGTSWWSLASLGALLVTTAFAVSPALHGAFTFDECGGVAANRAIYPGAPVGAAFSYRFSPDQARPLFFLSLWLDARVHGMSPVGFRATSLSLHLLCGAVVFLLLRRAGLRCLAPGHTRRTLAEGAALAGTSLFLLHPLQSESIIYIWGRSGVLSTLLSLLALLAVLPGNREVSRGAGAAAGSPLVPWRMACAWTLLALALAAKEEAIVLPLVAFVWCVSVEGLAPRRAAATASALAAPVVVFVVLRALLLGAAGRQVYVRSLADNILGQGVVNLRMIGLTLWPHGLSIDHAVGAPAPAVGLAAVGACLVLLALALTGAVRLRTPAPRAACAGAILYAAGTLLYWLVPLPDLMCERRAYLSLFGAALGATALVVAAGSRLESARASTLPTAGRAALPILPALVIAALLAPGLVARARLWAEPRLLWEEAARLAPAAARPHINLGVIAADRGDTASAASEFDRAVSLEPRNPEALYNRGRLRLDRGDSAGATEDLVASVAADPTVPRAHINLAVAEMRGGKLENAEEQLRLALAIDPDEPRALTNLAEILRSRGDAEEAIPLYRRALASDPGYAHAAARLGVALEKAGDRPGALAAYREYLARGAESSADEIAVRDRIAALEAALAAPGSIR